MDRTLHYVAQAKSNGLPKNCAIYIEKSLSFSDCVSSSYHWWDISRDMPFLLTLPHAWDSGQEKSTLN